MPLFSSRILLPEAIAFGAFLLGYVALFVAVPSLPLCVLGSCVLEPRPEAFLLAASLALGPGAVLGVATGGLAALQVYEALHPVGLTLLDAALAFVAFLVACGVARWLYVRRPNLIGTLAATWAVTGLVTLIIGSYGIVGRGAPFPEAYTSVLGQALLPINVAGVAFLVWVTGIRARRVAEG